MNSNCSVNEYTQNPKIEMFNPFSEPFSDLNEDKSIVAKEVVEYMESDNTKIVAKCTPCQCCACR